jgi:hypothetical protein
LCIEKLEGIHALLGEGRVEVKGCFVGGDFEEGFLHTILSIGVVRERAGILRTGLHMLAVSGSVYGRETV